MGRVQKKTKVVDLETQTRLLLRRLLQYTEKYQAVRLSAGLDLLYCSAEAQASTLNVS